MKLDGKTYRIIKWLVAIVIPACTTAYVGLAAVWNFPYAEEVAKHLPLSAHYWAQ